jgi:hypothetical protein
VKALRKPRFLFASWLVEYPTCSTPVQLYYAFASLTSSFTRNHLLNTFSLNLNIHIQFFCQLKLPTITFTTFSNSMDLLLIPPATGNPTFRYHTSYLVLCFKRPLFTTVSATEIHRLFPLHSPWFVGSWLIWSRVISLTCCFLMCGSLKGSWAVIIVRSRDKTFLNGWWLVDISFHGIVVLWFRTYKPGQKSLTRLFILLTFQRP